MKVEALQMVDRDTAAELYRKYKEHRAYERPHDAEIAAIYKHLARGRTVIRALESIRAAGLDESGLPRLAIARADQSLCYWHAYTSSEPHGVFSDSDSSYWAQREKASRSKNIRVEWPGLTPPKQTAQRRWSYEATVPLIPIHLRPKRGIQNYHILWEAEWTKRYPVDPYLLRRFGGDAWLVVAAWDLTEVERAVMSSMRRN